MATYCRGAPEVQAVDGLQTLYLMNSSAFSTGYADVVAAPSNMFLLYSAMSNSANPIDHQRQHLVGAVPLQPAAPLPHNFRSAPFPSATARLGTLSLGRSQHEVAVATHTAPAIAEQGKSFASFMMRTKCLKAAQQLLEELVDVCEGIKDVKIGKGTTSKNPAAEADGGGNVTAGVANLTAAERQELQMKKEKLEDMLKEVEARYKQYRHQMQVVVSSFEAIAGYGSSRAYTFLALRTISKHFRCLRDAIAGQVKASSRSLGEEDDKCQGSKLRFIDQHFRRQQALQQLGMMQHSSWRPQRGLPEHSVYVLRAWLFDHFLHPYPKDSDKLILAKQAGITRNQVSNWFINARVRLWKPMVEEMYMEEIEDHERVKNKEEEDPSKNTNANGSSTSEPNIAHKATEETTAITKAKKDNNSLLGSINEAKPEEISNQELLMRFMAGATGHGGGSFGEDPIVELRGLPAEQLAPRISGNAISLTLGLLKTSRWQMGKHLSCKREHLGSRMEKIT